MLSALEQQGGNSVSLPAVSSCEGPASHTPDLPYDLVCPCRQCPTSQTGEYLCLQDFLQMFRKGQIPPPSLRSLRGQHGRWFQTQLHSGPSHLVTQMVSP